MEPEVPELLENAPGLRRSAFKYYARLGYSRLRLNHLIGYLLGGNCTDDASLFSAVRTIIDWTVPQVPEIQTQLVFAAQELIRVADNSVSSVAAGLLLVSKFGSALEREQYMDLTYSEWSKSQWASRQFAAATPLLQPTAYHRIASAIIRSGLHEGLAVLSHIEQLSSLQQLDRQLRSYVLHQPAPGWAYPFGKVILASVLMNGSLHIEERSAIRAFLDHTIGDPYYRTILQLGPTPATPPSHLSVHSRINTHSGLP